MELADEINKLFNRRKKRLRIRRICEINKKKAVFERNYNNRLRILGEFLTEHLRRMYF